MAALFPTILKPAFSRALMTCYPEQLKVCLGCLSSLYLGLRASSFSCFIYIPKEELDDHLSDHRLRQAGWCALHNPKRREINFVLRR